MSNNSKLCPETSPPGFPGARSGAAMRRDQQQDACSYATRFYATRFYATRFYATRFYATRFYATRFYATRFFPKMVLQPLTAKMTANTMNMMDTIPAAPLVCAASASCVTPSTTV